MHFGIYGIAETISEIHKTQMLCVEKSRGPYCGFFDLPGGGSQKKEGARETLHREFIEETGYLVLSEKLLTEAIFEIHFTKNDQHIHLRHFAAFFRVELSTSTPDRFFPKPGEDVDSFQWLALSALRSSCTSPLVQYAVLLSKTRQRLRSRDHFSWQRGQKIRRLDKSL